MKFLALMFMFLSSTLWAQVAQSGHVWVVTKENHTYESVIGNSNLPYSVIALQIYVDNTLAYQVRGAGVQASIQSGYALRSSASVE
jgi:hypothetical protein